MIAATILGDASIVLAASAPPIPANSWQKVTPAPVGLNASKLNQIASTAKKGKSNCLVVVRHGNPAGEWYFNGTGPKTTQDVFAATKSFTSTFVGIAQDTGVLNVGEEASSRIPQWHDTPSAAVTVRELLSMDSGRKWSFQSDSVGLLAAADRTRTRSDSDSPMRAIPPSPQPNDDRAGNC